VTRPVRHVPKGSSWDTRFPVTVRMRAIAAVALSIPGSLILAAVACAGEAMARRAVKLGLMAEAKEPRPWLYGTGHW
jgi:hypothetical protein